MACAAFSWKERKQLGLDSSAYKELLRKKQPVYEFSKEFDLTGWENVTGKEFKISRVSTPEDVAAVVAFFVSADADYVNGQKINLNGGG